MRSDWGLLSFRRRLADAIAWCAGRADPGNPAARLWTPALRPSRLAEPRWHAGIGDLTPAECSEIVSDLAVRRAHFLLAEGRRPALPATDLAGGRLLLFEREGSLLDGAANFVTRGMFDDDTMPAWDTWVWHVFDAAGRAAFNAAMKEWRRGGMHPSHPQFPTSWTDFLVAWIAPELIPLAQKAIDVDPTGSTALAENVECAFTHSLGSAGLLPFPPSPIEPG
jgi:hypothetical protein